MLLGLALSLGLAGCGDAPSAPAPAAALAVDEALLARLEAAALSSMSRHGVPGAVVVVVSDDDLLYVGPFGRRNVEKEQPMTGRTLFRVGLGGALTSTLLSTLVDDNHLEWTSPLAEVLPAAGAPAGATVLDLLEGRVALPAPHDREGALPAAGWLAAAAVGGGDQPRQTLHHLLQSKVFGPAGMTTTALGGDLGAISEDFATPYGAAEGAADAEGEPEGSLPLVSTAPDLARFLILHLQGGIAQSGKRVSSPSNLATTRQPRAELGGDARHAWPQAFGVGRGLGWLSVELPWGGYHFDGVAGGDVPGFSAELGFLPQAGIGLVVLANQDARAGGGAFTAEIRDFFLRALLES